MNIEIKKMLSNGESETVEFKESFHDDALETIGAFSNAQGGMLLIGVQDSGKVVGFPIGKKTIEDLSNRIQEATEPRIQPSVLVYEFDGKSVVAIQVSKVIRGPVSIRGRYFKRTGKTNQRISHEEIMQRIVQSSGLSWDAVIEKSATIEDLDTKKIGTFIEAVRKSKRRPLPEKISKIDALRKMEFVEGNHPTRAALLLFGKNVDHFFPSAFLKIGRFRSPIHIVDDFEIHDSLFEQVQETMNWFRQRLETAFIITGKPQRDTVWEFPLDAIREAIINAVCHRDYSSMSDIQVRLYDDQLVIRNPGSLPFGLTTESLMREHNSIRRNQKIAEAFFLTGDIEKWGSGTTRIADELKAAGMPAPEFTSDQWNFRVAFNKKRFSERKSIQKLGLTERQTKIIEFLLINVEISNAQYQEVAKVSKATATRELRNLTSQGILESVGQGGASTRYRLTQVAIGSIGS